MSPGGVATLSERIESVRTRIAAAAGRARRDPASVRLIAVSKTMPASAIIAAWRNGVTDFGENRVQEALAKFPDVRAEIGNGPKFHFIGHLQTNKVADALPHFLMIHSVDSLRLLKKIADHAEARQTPARVLAEVNVSGEASKFGLSPSEVPSLLEEARGLSSVAVTGLMTVPPHVGDPERARPFFAMLRELAETHGLKDLSMGMTDDYEVAVEEGATHVRIGRAIFGEREQ